MSPRWAAWWAGAASLAVLGAVIGVGVGVGRAGGSTPSCAAPRPTAAPVVVAVVDSGLSSAAGLDPVTDARSSSLVGGVPVGTDGTGHGTAMAAIVHARAPQARLLPLTALDERGHADPAAVAQAVRQATADRADVVNLSLEGMVDDLDVRTAVADATAAGAVVVVAAGNEGRDLDGHPAWEQLSSIPGVVVVAAADDAGRLASSTDWGARVVDVAAPGRQIPTLTVDGRPTTSSGTSPAAAAVSGELALALAGTGTGTTCSSAVATVLLDRAERSPHLDGRTASGWLR